MKRPESVLLQRKILAFQRDPQQQTYFEKLVRQLPLPCILWPSYHAASFPQEFCVQGRGKEEQDYIFPLVSLRKRLYYSAIKLEELARTEYEELHPILAYLFLSCFGEQLHSFGRELKITAKKEWKSLCSELEKLKRSLDVPRKLGEKKKQQDLHAEFLSEFQSMSRSYIQILKEKEKIESEVAALGVELEIKQKQSFSTEKLESYNQDLRASLEHERKLAARLGKELKRITEKILSSHHLDQNSSLLEEYQNLRHEYNLLTRKNDALVSKNIELANRVDKNSRTQAYKLEEILDSIQRRINVLLQREYSDDHEILLRSIEKEILELNRARSYLGRGLYNLGILYLRMGDMENAVKEFRAARELGVSDIKAEKVIASLS